MASVIGECLQIRLYFLGISRRSLAWTSSNSTLVDVVSVLSHFSSSLCWMSKKTKSGLRGTEASNMIIVNGFQITETVANPGRKLFTESSATKILETLLCRLFVLIPFASHKFPQKYSACAISSSAKSARLQFRSHTKSSLRMTN